MLRKTLHGVLSGSRVTHMHVPGEAEDATGAGGVGGCRPLSTVRVVLLERAASLENTPPTTCQYSRRTPSSIPPSPGGTSLPARPPSSGSARGARPSGRTRPPQRTRTPHFADGAPISDTMPKPGSSTDHRRYTRRVADAPARVRTRTVWPPRPHPGRLANRPTPRHR